MGSCADEILRGTSPGDLPIQGALSHELVVNLQTARRIHVTVPLALLAKATKLSSERAAPATARVWCWLRGGG
jgi:ABC-type uncharacterized transport system substrate-binding protein